jgi:hypothetical protein
LDAALPDGRISLVVKNGDDLDTRGVRPVIHAVRESVHNGLANVREYDRMHLGIDGDPIKYLLYPGHEVNTPTCPLALVIIERFIELGEGLIAQNDGEAHERALARARAFTTSQGVTASGRAMLSASRRSSSFR